MRIPLRALRDLTTQELARLATKYPKAADGLRSLQEHALPRLQGDEIEFDALADVLEAIVQDADNLENELGDAAGGYVFAASQDLVSKLEDSAKRTLANDVLVLPELAVQLNIADETKPHGQETIRAEAGCRTKLGGTPDWIQNNATPTCSGCKRLMTFVAEIDSISAAKNELGRSVKERGSYMFADAGMIYVFWCTKCNETQSVLQCS